jgi:hypothetical protein
MNWQTVSVLGVTAIILLMLRPTISNSQSEMPKSPTQDGTMKALAAVAGAGSWKTTTTNSLENSAMTSALA